MSIPGNTPFYIVAHKRDDGLIDFALMNPRGWGPDETVYKGTGTRDERQMLERCDKYAPPWQQDVEIHWS